MKLRSNCLILLNSFFVFLATIPSSAESLKCQDVFTQQYAQSTAQNFLKPADDLKINISDDKSDSAPEASDRLKAKYSLELLKQISVVAQLQIKVQATKHERRIELTHKLTKSLEALNEYFKGDKELLDYYSVNLKFYSEVSSQKLEKLILDRVNRENSINRIYVAGVEDAHRLSDLIEESHSGIFTSNSSHFLYKSKESSKINILRLSGYHTSDKLYTLPRSEDFYNFVALEGENAFAVVDRTNYEQNRIKIFSLSDFKEVREFEIEMTPFLLDIMQSPDKKTFIVIGGTTFKGMSIFQTHIVDVKTGNVLKTINQGRQYSKSIFSKDGKYILQLSVDGVFMYDLSKNKKIDWSESLKIEEDAFIEFTYNSNHLVFKNKDSDIQVVNLISPKKIDKILDSKKATAIALDVSSEDIYFSKESKFSEVSMLVKYSIGSNAGFEFKKMNSSGRIRKILVQSSKNTIIVLRQNNESLENREPYTLSIYRNFSDKDEFYQAHIRYEEEFKDAFISADFQWLMLNYSSKANKFNPPFNGLWGIKLIQELIDL